VTKTILKSCILVSIPPAYVRREEVGEMVRELGKARRHGQDALGHV
jgi:hypothetical protein